MREGIFEIASNREIADNIFEMSLYGDASEIKNPGQFVNISLPGFYLRRPLSVCDYSKDSFSVIYKTVGKGTESMSFLKPGERLNILTGLGNGFDMSKSGDSPVLIGGGVGIPPLYALAKRLIQNGKKVTAILGFNSAGESFLINEFELSGADCIVMTVDGSLGNTGFVTEGLKSLSGYSYFYACGPKAMLEAVSKAFRSGGEVSMEERMGCGFGACMGCSIMTKSGAKRVCKEGPVFAKEDIIWQEWK